MEVQQDPEKLLEEVNGLASSLESYLEELKALSDQINLSNINQKDEYIDPTHC